MTSIERLKKLFTRKKADAPSASATSAEKAIKEEELAQPISSRERLEKFFARKKADNPETSVVSAAKTVLKQESAQSTSNKVNLKKLFMRKTSIERLKKLRIWKKPDISTAQVVSAGKTVTEEVTPIILEIPVVEPEKGKKIATPAVGGTVVVESYPLNPPYADASIVRDTKRGGLTYVVTEPELTAQETAHLKKLKDILMEVLDVNLMKLESKEDAKKYLENKCREILNNYDFKITKESEKKLLYYMVRDNIGLDKIDPIMYDQFIEDISCDGTGIPLYVWHRKYESIPTTIRFTTAQELNNYVLRLAYLAGSHISIAQPMLDGALPDGNRINLTYGTEITRKGSTFTIRKFKTDPLTIIDLIDFNTVSTEMAAYFWFAVENRISIVVSGGVAAGKTTSLNCLSMFIKPDMKIVSIEDTPELNLPHENWIPTTTRTHVGLGTEAADISLFDLLKSSLRQRPDYIIVGEVRGAEAYALFQAISTGHMGMSTLHAESVEAAVYRLESEPMNVPRTLISAIDVITVQKRVDQVDRPTRRNITTSEIVGLDPRSKEILTNEVFKWNAMGDTFEYTGRSYLIERIATKKGMSMEEANEEIQRRAKVLGWMRERRMRSYRDVSDIVRRYYEDPAAVYKEATKHEKSAT
jgi:flagellar protein FlaI